MIGRVPCLGFFRYSFAPRMANNCFIRIHTQTSQSETLQGAETSEFKGSSQRLGSLVGKGLNPLNADYHRDPNIKALNRRGG